jgi:catechol-2,3-dioxygenase
MSIKGICELTLETDDPDGLAAFYEEIGLERLATTEADRVWLAAGESCRLGLWTSGKKEHGDRGGGHVHFAFSVGPGAIERIGNGLRDRAIEVEGPVEHEGGDRSIYFDDPEGNRVEVWDFFETREGRRAGMAALDDR